ncbi:MAG TPA: nucleotidyltransferase family protein [Nocardioides sp.]
MRVHGLLLAAGAGRRMGTPKALVDDWLLRTIGVLEDGGCDEVTVVLGAAADQARVLLEGSDVAVVVAADWAQGMGASLRAGLSALPAGDAALVSLVDLPDVGPEVVRRVLAAPFVSTTLRRAAYEAVPGHPVLLGRGHWDGVLNAARGDRGARDYLSAHEVELVECADLATGRDVDSR